MCTLLYDGLVTIIQKRTPFFLLASNKEEERLELFCMMVTSKEEER